MGVPPDSVDAAVQAPSATGQPGTATATYTPALSTQKPQGVEISFSTDRPDLVLLDATQRLAKVGGWSWDVARQTMTWTTETYRIHGMEPGMADSGSAEHIALSLACYDPEERAVIEAAFRRCADEGLPYVLEFPLTTVDGRRIWIQTAAQPVFDGDRRLLLRAGFRKKGERENRAAGG